MKKPRQSAGLFHYMTNLQLVSSHEGQNIVKQHGQ